MSRGLWNGEKMEINTNELNEKVISEQGMLYYLSECTDFLCHLPEWMFPHIDAELAGKKSMHLYYEEAKGNTIEEEVEKSGASKTWIDDGIEDPLLTIIIFEDQGIPEIAFAGSNEGAKKVWDAMMREFNRTTGEENCEYTDATIHTSWDAGFFGHGEDIYRVQHKTLNDTNIPMEIADGDRIRAIRPGTEMPVTILTSIHSGIPETWFVGSEEEAKKEWEQAMLEIEGRRENRAERDGEEPDYSCDYSDDGERTTKNAWDAGYFCDHKDEYRVDGYSVEVA